MFKVYCIWHGYNAMHINNNDNNNNNNNNTNKNNNINTITTIHLAIYYYTNKKIENDDILVCM